MSETAQTQVKVGIKEITELNAGLKLVGVAVKKIAADKKVNLADIPVGLDLATHATVLIDAVEGIQNIPTEVKDLDAEEAKVLLQQYLDLIHAIKEA